MVPFIPGRKRIIKVLDYTFIYTLICPETDIVRYIGKSNNPKRRYHAHMRIDKTACSHKINWVQSLLKRGLKPKLEIIKKVPMDEWKEWERYYINIYRDKGKLTNCKDGGEGSSRGNKTSFKKGIRPWNTGTRKKKTCAICGELFEVSPTGNKKYKCCSMKCSCVYRSNNPNKGCFIKGQEAKNKVVVLQIDSKTNKVLNKYNSIKKAQAALGIGHISSVINGKRNKAGGFKWKRA